MSHPLSLHPLLLLLLLLLQQSPWLKVRAAALCPQQLQQLVVSRPQQERGQQEQEHQLQEQQEQQEQEQERKRGA